MMIVSEPKTRLSSAFKSLSFEALRGSAPLVAEAAITLDRASIDDYLGGGLARAAVHEIYSDTSSDVGSVRSLAAMVGIRASSLKRLIVWITQDSAIREIGALHAEGLSFHGADPNHVIVITARTANNLLQAALDAAKCKAVAAVVVETWGEPKSLDLTTTRRLTLAAQSSGVVVLFARMGAHPSPSAAETRWCVRAVPSHSFLANAPGYPAFKLSLLRHRRGIASKTWYVEWHPHDHLFHRAAYSGALDTVSDNRSAAPKQYQSILRIAG